MTAIRDESMTLPWITDRLPSETDAAFDGTVVVQTPGPIRGWGTIDWCLVETGTPWLPYGPPKKPEPRAPRKAVQLALCQDCTMAVADDGSIWMWSDSLRGWRDFPPLPDREEVE